MRFAFFARPENDDSSAALSVYDLRIRDLVRRGRTVYIRWGGNAWREIGARLRRGADSGQTETGFGSCGRPWEWNHISGPAAASRLAGILLIMIPLTY